jgi:hypothetical protein
MLSNKREGFFLDIQQGRNSLGGLQGDFLKILLIIWNLKKLV